MTGNHRASQPDDAGRTVEGMDHRAETRDFLTTRRARITPEQAGLPAYGTGRRVPGLRREEDGRLQPGRVFDRTISLDQTPDGYRAMDQRQALKVLVRP